MTKAQFGCSLDVTAIEGLRSTAQEIGAPIGDLLALCVRFTLTKMPREKLEEWARKVPVRVGRPRGGGLLNADEKRAAGAMDVLAGLGPARVWTVTEIARQAGQHVRDTYRALRGLASRGQIGTWEGEDLDRWGRPMAFLAWFTDAAKAPPKVDHGVVASLLEDLRAEMARTSFEPLAIGVIRFSVMESAGWSDAAQALPAGLESSTPDVTGDKAAEWFAARWRL